LLFEAGWISLLLELELELELGLKMRFLDIGGQILQMYL